MIPLRKDNDPDNDNEFNAALEFTTMIQVNMLSLNLLQKETPVSAQRAIISLADIQLMPNEKYGHGFLGRQSYDPPPYDQ